MAKEEKITEKQMLYILNALDKYDIDLEQIKDLTKQEAAGIIKRNIIEKRPLLRWYIYCIDKGYGIKKRHEIGSSIDMFAFKDFVCVNGEYQKVSLGCEKLFLKKRQAEEFLKKASNMFSWKILK